MTDSKLSECGIKCLPEPDGSGHHADCRYSVPSDDALRRIYYGNYLARQFCDGLRDVWLAGIHARDAEVAKLERDVASWRGDYEECSRQRAALAVLHTSTEDERIIDVMFAEASRNRKTTRMVPESRIAELEAEVAELRKRLEKDDHDLSKVLSDRDDYHDAADELAYAIADAETIGEHSNANNPWKRALEALDVERERHDSEVAKLQERIDELESHRDMRIAGALESPRRTPELTERVARQLIYMYGATVSKPRAEHHMHNANAVLDLVFGKERKNAP